MMKKTVIPFVFALPLVHGGSIAAAKKEEIAEQTPPYLTNKVLALTRHECHENGVVAAWCDARMDESLDCSIHPTLNMYMCRCPKDPRACPGECIQGTSDLHKEPHVVQCQGIPQDEPNYILKSDHFLPHNYLMGNDHEHCENNALVANWCNEEMGVGMLDQVDCLLLPALDEYACVCHSNPAACPQDCIGGHLPIKKTKHSVRCKNIPKDDPNYVLLEKKA